MRWSVVKTIFTKELVETLRDRRTLFAMFVLPVLIHPLLFLLLGNVTAAETKQRKTLEPTVAVWGPLPPSAEAALQREIGLRVIERRPSAPTDGEAEALRLLEKKTVELVLAVPGDADTRVSADGGVELTLYYDSVDHRSDGAESRLRKALATWNEAQLADRLKRHHLPPGFDRALKPKSTDVATKARRGAEVAGRALPIVLLFVMITCGLLPAVDLTAGEKERGTLQTLLTAPVRPVEIVAGKYLTVVLVSVIGAAANLLAMGFALSRLTAGVEELAFTLHLSTAIAVFATFVPGALLLSALLLAMAVFARSFREAQSYLTPIMLAVLLPAMVALLPGVELDAKTALIPICNLALLARALLAGTATLELGFVVVVANLAYATAAVLLAARVFETEQVLLSGERPWRDVFGRALRTSVTPTPRQALLFAVVLLVVIYYGAVFMNPKRVGALGAIAVLQLGLLLLPSVAWAAAFRLSLRETFSLRLPSKRGALGILFLASGTWAVSQLFARGVGFLFPGSQAYADLLKDFFEASSVPMMAAVAVLPAICEEAAYRGVMLSGLANSGSRVVAVAGSALAFGILHMNPYHVTVASFTGAFLGYATLETGSILASAIMHVANNGLVMVALHHPSLERAMDSPLVLAAACVSCAIGVVLVRGSRR